MDIDGQNVLDEMLGERDASVLHLIGEENLARFTFEGLKRRLGVHSETLSRILYRLKDQGMLEKGADGYIVTVKVKELFQRYPSSPGIQGIPLLQTFLPPGVSIQQLIDDLTGKWFGLLRWFGFAENENSYVLKWVTTDGGVQVDAVITRGMLSIEAKLLQDEDTTVALRAAYQLVAYVSKLYVQPGRIQRVSFFGATTHDFDYITFA